MKNLTLGKTIRLTTVELQSVATGVHKLAE